MVPIGTTADGEVQLFPRWNVPGHGICTSAVRGSSRSTVRAIPEVNQMVMGVSVVLLAEAGRLPAARPIARGDYACLCVSPTWA